MNGSLTQAGDSLLNTHRIDNAVILSAGMSTRFVPLNFEIPKGLLTVKGEPLIERQICQLREKGIEEIIIVVGYMKEQFEYLVGKYGVILVETDEYETKNNHASIWAARQYLKIQSSLHLTYILMKIYSKHTPMIPSIVQSMFQARQRKEALKQMMTTGFSQQCMAINAMTYG